MPNIFNIHDYEIDKLLERRAHYRKSSKNVELTHSYTRMLIAYMARLVFAIGWQKIRSSANDEINHQIYTNLFKESYATNETKSIEPGALAHLLKSCAKELNLTQQVKKEIDILYTLGNVRNTHAHDEDEVYFDEFYKESDEIFSQFADHFKDKNCIYIIPIEYSGKDEILCYKLAEGDSFAEEIQLPSNCFEWEHNGNRLFYSVTDNNTNQIEYYCLSPFIEVPENCEDKEPHFRIYERMQNNGYGSDCDQLRYRSVIPSPITEKNGEKLDYCYPKTTSKYRRACLFADFSDNQNGLWNYSINRKDIGINISSYPGFDDIRTHKYKYCQQISHIWKHIMDFCNDSTKQVVQITGNGGIGKTALVLSILNNFFNETPTNYTNLIFFSAKKSYYALKKGQFVLNDFENESDIHDYNDLVNKLSNLILDAQSEQDTAQKIINQINDLSSYHEAKKFLLVIDDLDSLQMDDQRKIVDFVHKFDSRALKTIITTRNISDNPPTSYQLHELNEKESIDFAKWYIDNSDATITSWDNWNRKEVAEEWIKSSGEGNPLIIQMLLHLVKTGLENNFNISATRKERTAYLYSTVQNLLTPEEKTIFRICCHLYASLPKDKINQEMPLLIVKYLAAGCDLSDDSQYENAIRKLASLKLIVINSNGAQFKVLSNLFDGNIMNMDSDTLPAIFHYLWENILEDADKWFYIYRVEETVANFFMSMENKKGFDVITAKSVLEQILEGTHISSELREQINSWMSRHTINQNALEPQDQVYNLIEKIERTWQDLKKLYDADQKNKKLSGDLRYNIVSLRNLLNQQNYPDILDRLKTVQNEISEYE